MIDDVNKILTILNREIFGTINIRIYLNPTEHDTGIYDVYRVRKTLSYGAGVTEELDWLFSRNSPDNIFTELSKFDSVNIEFVDNTIGG